MRIPITVSIFSVIMIVGAAISASIVGYNFSSQRESAQIVTAEIMARSAETLQLKLAALVRPVEAIANLSPAWPGIDIAPSPQGHPMRSEFVSLLRNYSHISAINIGFSDGAFYMVATAQSRPQEKLEQLNAPPETAYVEQIILRDIPDKPLVIRNFLDAQGKLLLATKRRDSDYDPRVRPWFRAAMDSGTVSRSRIYLFKGSGKPGLTISRRNGAGVVGVDITLEQIEAYLNREPQAREGVLAIMSGDGTILASAGNAQAREPVLKSLADHIRTRPDFRAGMLDILGRPWIAHIAKAPLGADSNEVLALALPVSVIAAPIIRVLRNSLLVSLAIVLASAPVVWLVSRVLSRPLIRLVAEAERIRHFDLTNHHDPASLIDEIQQLQSAIARMRHSLATFSLYVPKSLVRKLIERDEAPELGGQRRDITVMFMDIENFTAMSADLGAEELMRRISSYFEIVTRTLLEHGATIDKYMGDGVMAFWNAPEDTPQHTQLACRAALAVREVAAAETEKWQREGKPPLRTRIGLHCGEAVVGNVGSSDRMNYTAIGATVNMASRLESANRDLGTDILTSREITARAGDGFTFRPAGSVALKGFDTPVEVFELVSRHDTRNTPDPAPEAEDMAVSSRMS